jgi:hypothetical protein
VFASQTNSNTRKRLQETALIAKATPGRAYKKVLKGDCRTCGQESHKYADCWGEIQNKEKIPANRKREGAQAVTAKKCFNCGYCHKPGQTEDKCFKKKRKVATPEKLDETAFCVNKTACITRALELGILNDTTFIADTGKSSHMVYSKEVLTRCGDPNKVTNRGSIKNSLIKQISVYFTDSKIKILVSFGKVYFSTFQ